MCKDWQRAKRNDSIGSTAKHVSGVLQATRRWKNMHLIRYLTKWIQHLVITSRLYLSNATKQISSLITDPDFHPSFIHLAILFHTMMIIMLSRNHKQSPGDECQCRKHEAIVVYSIATCRPLRVRQIVLALVRHCILSRGTAAPPPSAPGWSSAIGIVWTLPLQALVQAWDRKI